MYIHIELGVDPMDCDNVKIFYVLCEELVAKNNTIDVAHNGSELIQVPLVGYKPISVRSSVLHTVQIERVECDETVFFLF